MNQVFSVNKKYNSDGTLQGYQSLYLTSETGYIPLWTELEVLKFHVKAKGFNTLELLDQTNEFNRKIERIDL